MRVSILRGVALAAAIALPSTLLAQSTPNSGGLFTGCSTAPAPFPILANGGEFYSCKAKAGTPYTDWMYDLGTGRDKTPSTVTDDSGSYFLLGGNFTQPEAASDVFFNIVTFPNGQVAVDSVTVGSGGAAGFTQPQIVGNSLAAGQLAGTGLTLAPGGYAVPGIANRGAGPGTFPYGTRNGIEVAFAPLVDINNTDVTAGADCAWGGAAPDAALTGPSAGKGLIIGYNVYRMQSAAEPTRAALGVGANFQYFLNIRDHNLNVADVAGMVSGDQNGDTVPDGDGVNSPNDPNPDGDLTGVHNPTVGAGFTYNGDEVVIFQDTATVPGGAARATGSTPVAGMPYWYAFQPVVNGLISDFATANIAKRGAMDLRVDQNMDGMMDSVNLDIGMDATASSLEFISPQANFGLPGLGLTNAGAVLLSQPVMGMMNAAAAAGQVNVTVTVESGNVNIQFQSALEGGNVLGYNVYRMAGDTRTQVNEQLIAARGGEGNVYRVIDDASTSSRRTGRRDAAASYGVEVVYSDGSASKFIGPFQVSVGQETTRRQR